MIVVLGDLHGAIELGIALVARALDYRSGSSVPVIQVGDLEWHPKRPPRQPPWPVFFIEGNHDHLPSLLCHDKVTEVTPGWIYCPRGTILELDGMCVGFLGGAKSIDRAWRKKDVEWWDSEEPTFEEARRLRGRKVDLLVTHTPPAFVVREMGYSENDYASVVVEEIWEELGKPRLVCGHMHRRYRSGNILVLGDLDVDIIGAD